MRKKKRVRGALRRSWEAPIDVFLFPPKPSEMSREGTISAKRKKGLTPCCVAKLCTTYVIVRDFATNIFVSNFAQDSRGVVLTCVFWDIQYTYANNIYHPSGTAGAAVVWWSDYPPPTKANRVRLLEESLPGCSHAGIAPDDVAGRRVFPGISRLSRPRIPMLLHTHIASPALALNTLMLSYKKLPQSAECAFEINLRKKSLPMSACTSTGTLSDMRPKNYKTFNVENVYSNVCHVAFNIENVYSNVCHAAFNIKNVYSNVYHIDFNVENVYSNVCHVAFNIENVYSNIFHVAFNIENVYNNVYHVAFNVENIYSNVYYIAFNTENVYSNTTMLPSTLRTPTAMSTMLPSMLKTAECLDLFCRVSNMRANANKTAILELSATSEPFNDTHATSIPHQAKEALATLVEHLPEGTVASARYLCIRASKMSAFIPSVVNRNPTIHWRRPWKILADPNISSDLRAAALGFYNNIISTQQRKYSIHLKADPACPLCGNTDTTLHRVISYVYAAPIWQWCRIRVRNFFRDEHGEVSDTHMLHCDVITFPSVRRRAASWFVLHAIGCLVDCSTLVTVQDFVQLLRQDSFQLISEFIITFNSIAKIGSWHASDSSALWQALRELVCYLPADDVNKRHQRSWWSTLQLILPQMAAAVLPICQEHVELGVDQSQHRICSSIEELSEEPLWSKVELGGPAFPAILALALNSNGATVFCVDLRTDIESSIEPRWCNRASVDVGIKLWRVITHSSPTLKEPRLCSGQTTYLPLRRTGFGSRRIFARGERGGQYRQTAGSLYLPLPPLALHSTAAPSSPHFTLVGAQDPALKPFEYYAPCKVASGGWTPKCRHPLTLLTELPPPPSTGRYVVVGCRLSLPLRNCSVIG
ncbi:hypothetical protein PR048_031551 [Dryococelus australis]|uniref:Uncharacterized protein n=1 Tax=Dryococelus australis TaxID=614101 RepID=A0ABQ9G8K3_9NEOP|nr:hypothetical protein PR048_031551 [Dryococelus australis]